MGTLLKIVVAVCVVGIIGVVAVVVFVDVTPSSLPSSPSPDSGEATSSSALEGSAGAASGAPAEEGADSSLPPTEDTTSEQPFAPSGGDSPAPPQPVRDEPGVVHWIGQAAASTLVPLDEGLRQLALAVAEASGGRLILSVETMIVPSGQEWSAVADGALDFCAGGGSFLANELRFGPAFTQLAGGMPPLANLEFHKAEGADIMNEWFDDKHWELFDIPGAGFHGTPEIWMHSADRISTPADLVEMKIATRSVDSASILEAMGMTPVMIPVAEVAEAMDSGVIDACECGSAAANHLFGLEHVSNYAYLSPTRAPTQAFEFLVNSRRFEALPSDLQGLVIDVAQDQALEFHQRQVDRDDEALEQMQHAGLSVRTLPSSIEELCVDKARDFYRDEVEDYPELEEYLEAYFEFAEDWEDEYGFSYPVITSLD